jgi:hypothetical protein
LKDNIKMDPNDSDFEVGWWMGLAQCCVQWEALALEMLNLRILQHSWK